MNIQRFIAASSREALDKARAVFGENTLILSNRPTANGVEVMATAEDALGNLDQGNTTSPSLMAAIQAREADETRAPKQAPKPPMRMDALLQQAKPAAKVSPRQSVAEDTEQLAMSTLSFQNYVRERMLRRRNEEMSGEIAPQELPTFARKQHNRLDAVQDSAPAVVKHNPLRGLAIELPQEAPRKAAAPAAASPALMNELQSVKDLIEERFNTLTWMNQTRANPLHSNLMLKLIRSGYSPALSRTIMERLPQDAGPTDALKWLGQVLERNLRTDKADAPIWDKGGVFALVGSTGVGKTTTAAKLAALCAAKHGPNSVGLITLDTYRVGGHEQLRAYGRMLGVVAHLAHDKAALQDLLGLLAGKKMVIIDTTGVAPRDPRKDDILEVLNLPGIERLLVANAGAHGDTLDEALAAFKRVGCKQAILSKVDEAVKLAPALDALIRHQLVLRGITNGQRVPEDFARADAKDLVTTSMRTHTKSAFDPSTLDMDFYFTESSTGLAQGALHA
jgi:flagellar biosynthesis protein FlhF